jgi:hypothetical protein
MQFLGLLSQVGATLLLTIPLLRVTWHKRQGRFPLWGTLWKVTLYAVILSLLAYGIEMVLHAALAPSPEDEPPVKRTDRVSSLYPDEEIYPLLADPHPRRGDPYPIHRLP